MTATAETGTETLWAEEPSSTEGHARIRARIAGLHCSLCTGTIEKALGRMPGVGQVAVSLTHEQALIDYEPDVIASEEILGTLRDIGYDLYDPRKLRPFEDEEADLVREGTRLLAAIAAGITAIALILEVSGIWSLLVPASVVALLVPVSYAVLRPAGRARAALGAVGILLPAGLAHAGGQLALFGETAAGWVTGVLALSLVFGVAPHILRMACQAARRRILNQHVLLEAGPAARHRPRRARRRRARHPDRPGRRRGRGAGAARGTGPGRRAGLRGPFHDGPVAGHRGTGAGRTAPGRRGGRRVDQRRRQPAGACDPGRCGELPGPGGAPRRGCPPLAIVRAAGEAADLGIIMRTGEAFQTFGQVATVLLDKTGTLTEGRPAVRELQAIGTEEELLATAAAADSLSEHPLARAVVAAAQQRGLTVATAEEFGSVTGFGVTARVAGREVLVGRPRFVADRGVDLGPLSDAVIRLEGAGRTVVAVAVDGAALGVIALGDEIRADAAPAVAQLRDGGLTPVLVTEDNPQAAHIAAQLGIDDVRAGVLPEGKAQIVREFQTGDARVAMVGDGINDAPALMQADVGIAMGGGTDIAVESADIIIVRDDLHAVLAAQDLSRVRRRRQRRARVCRDRPNPWPDVTWRAIGTTIPTAA